MTTAFAIGQEVFQGYRLRQLIHRGSFNSVWLADNSQGKEIALKFLSCDDPSARAKLRSLQAMTPLRHPHLTPIDHVWSYDQYFVVAMPLADGSLQDVLEAYQSEYGTGVEPADLCPLLAQAADALDFLNARRHLVGGLRVGFQHGAIKPSNLLLFGETLKVADLEYATSLTAALKYHDRASAREFAAPEVLQGRLSQWSDQFSLAVCYCYLRGGRLPFTNPGALSLHSSNRSADLSMLSPQERPLITRGMSMTPQNRWPSCREMIAHLAKALGIRL
ncbi:MAG: serine/threonine protein kinase [Gemmataceae bacterium]